EEIRKVLHELSSSDAFTPQRSPESIIWKVPIARNPKFPRSLRAFLCHSSGDRLRVRNLYRRLRADGIDPWIDKENLLPGQKWQQEIRNTMRIMDVVIVCISRNSANK